MRLLPLALLLCAGASAAEVHCAADGDCAKLGAGYECVAQKIACAEHPESSTCATRLCRRKPGWPVKDEDRACTADGDCAVVLLECRCMYCARPEDWMTGVAAAANKGKIKGYEKLGKCSRAQQSACATAGACAMTGTSEARCRAGRCVVEYAPRSGL